MCERMIEPNEWDYDDDEAYEHDMNMWVDDLLYGEEQDRRQREQEWEWEQEWLYGEDESGEE